MRERPMSIENGQSRQLRSSLGEWTIIADEIRFLYGSEWDVYALHVGGDRVPLGPNLHRNPDPEIVRLKSVVA